MAVKVRRTFRGETSRTADDGKEETWYYDVHADSITYTVTQAKMAADTDDPTDPLKFIPAKGAVHPDDPELICQQITADRDAELPTLIRVAVQWRSLRNNGNDGATGSDDGSSSPATPTWNIELAFDREAYTVARNIDLDKKPLRNVVGDPLEPYEMPKSDAVYLYSYYVKNLDWDAMGEATGCINKTEVVLTYNGRTKTFAKHTLRIDPRFNPVQTIEPTIPGGSRDVIYKVECRLSHNKEGWGVKLTNQGYNHYRPADGTEGDFFTVRATDDQGQPTSSAIYLAADGTPLAEDAEVVLLPLPAGSETKSPGFRFHEELDFTTLPGFGG